MQYLENFPERVYKSMLIPLMMEDKRAGKINQTALVIMPICSFVVNACTDFRNVLPHIQSSSIQVKPLGRGFTSTRIRGRQLLILKL
jgi:hypothetical protein